ncbi:MAG: hypothetical protein KC416_14885 [Myxococcales bacterium]|nr:hypothetical protein [Myxococcales bacterium]
MRRSIPFLALLLGAFLFSESVQAQFEDPESGEGGYSSGGAESNCTDRLDEDGDGLVDCADSDCYEDAACEAGGTSERSPSQCSDWVDNDGDGAIDCDDSDCQQAGVPYCQGSAAAHRAGSTARSDAMDEELPELGDGMAVEDLIGQGGDLDGERNDYMCADGIDNDNDGRTDCADFGCRFDPSVTVCQSRPDMVFSIVAMGGLTLDMSDTDDIVADAGFTRIQARALGSIPMIDNSFFLLSMRLERTPRLVFAVFEVPIGDTGHRLGINSGAGNLSSGPIVSIHKLPILERPFYLYNAFEQGSGMAVEVRGPITDDRFLEYRAFASGGSGLFNGNVGGRFFRDGTENFSWALGAQLQLNAVGFYDRYDTFYLYTPVPTTLALLLGGKYEERTTERFGAANGQLIFRWSHLIMKAESYARYLSDYETTQVAWNVLVGALALPKHIFLAADVGSFYSQDYLNLPGGAYSAAIPRPLDELQWRVAAHWYFFQNIGVLSLVYSELYIEENPDRPDAQELERQLLLQAQFRF